MVGDPGESLSFSRDYGFSRGQATREADAAARALFDSGAEEVIIWDNHGCGANLEFDRLDERCQIALGSGFARRWPGLDGEFTGVVMIGYHAMEGTPDGVLAHTYSPHAYEWIKVNGRKVGEIALDAAVAGEQSVPLVFVASDDCGCAEAREFTPWVETVSTKEGRGCNCAFSKPPKRAAEEIYDGVRRAVAQIDRMKCFTFDLPADVELRLKRVRQACKARIRRKGWKLTGLRSLRRTFETLTEWSC